MARPQYDTFIFERYVFHDDTGVAEFHYSFDGEQRAVERVQFALPWTQSDHDIRERSLELALFVAGTSYYKSFPTKAISYRRRAFSPFEATFINTVYSEGLSQFLFENRLDPRICPRVTGVDHDPSPRHYDDRGVLLLQSGGKDSLLLGELLKEQHVTYIPWYVTSHTTTYPAVIEQAAHRPPRLVRRYIDHHALAEARAIGGLNGHVPVTYIVLAYAVIDAVLHGENVILSAIGSEGEEPHAMVGDMPVRHQWSKTLAAEQLLSAYVTHIISPDIHVGSPLRRFSELRIAELFSETSWDRYIDSFSSCNQANYKQGHANTHLTWCGVCPKCVNTYMLFSPFIPPRELQRLFHNTSLFTSSSVECQRSLKGLLGIDGVMKPLECVGEIEELRTAYAMAYATYGTAIGIPPFAVPSGHFDYRRVGDAQTWTLDYLPERLRDAV